MLDKIASALSSIVNNMVLCELPVNTSIHSAFNGIVQAYKYCIIE
jgi:hypothetical protein